jgi:putative hemolysin
MGPRLPTARLIFNLTRFRMLSLELLIIVLLIVINGLLSMSELAVVSSRPARLSLMASKGVRGAERAMALASDPGKFLSTVQIGITLVGVLSGAFSGATLGQRLTLWLIGLGLPVSVADILGVGIVVTIITYATLIVGELVPKQVALRDPERIAVRVAPALGWLARLSLPVVMLLDVSGKLILTLFGRRGAAEERVSEDEIHHLVNEAESAGVLEPGEKEMIAGVMRLGDRPVGAVMTPRTEVDEIDLNDDPVKVRDIVTKSPHSRFPVSDGDRDEPIGVLQSRDMLVAYMHDRAPELRSLVREAPIIPSSADARDVLAILKAAPVHIGLVHDEYGAFEGVVTATDILESIVGAFHSEEGPPEPAVVRRSDGSLLISGWMPVDDLGELLSIPLPPRRRFHTVAGLVLQRFNQLPEIGDSFDLEGWKIEVVDLDGRRIDKVLASRRDERGGGQKQGPP